MTDEPPPDAQDIFDHAWESAQRLALDVIQCPAEKRDAVLQQMGTILTEIAIEVGCPREMAPTSAPPWSERFANTLQKN